MPTSPPPPPSAPLSLEEVRAIARLLHEADLSEIEIETLDAPSAPSSTSTSGDTATAEQPTSQPSATPRVRLQMRRGTDPTVARRTLAAAHAPNRGMPQATPPQPGATPEAGPATWEVLSPAVGIFRALQPALAVGDEVKAGQKAGAVEALKVPTDILFERDGRVSQVMVEDGNGVEYAQPLFLVTSTD